jgi:hypothetical protein
MCKLIYAPLFVASLFFSSCQQLAKQEDKKAEINTTVQDQKLNPLIGSWVEPNPINEKEVQGITLNEDGTAESINMATLLYKKWWQQNDELVLVSESIGNKQTIVDTSKYPILTLNALELELKIGIDTIKYRRQ